MTLPQQPPPSLPLSLPPPQPVDDPTKTKQPTPAGMEIMERSLVAKLQAGGMLQRSESSSTVDALSTASPSTAPSGSPGPGKVRSSPKLCSFSRGARGVLFSPRVARVSPGAAFVAAVRPSARVDPRAVHFSGSGAIHQ